MEEMETQRRSQRKPEDAFLERSEVKQLLQKIRENHPDTVVLKIKEHLPSDVAAVVVDAIIETLRGNKVCQALYLQNLSKAFGDKQLKALVPLLQRRLIWCLNLGENYEVSASGWVQFCKALPKTNVTHLYVSEHVIKTELKNKMRLYIRNNRSKHKMHSSQKNLHVIERCTHCWWNPINGVKHQQEIQAAQRLLHPLTPKDPAYWQDGQGIDKPWKFNCQCGETCSSYENYRYHPTGAQYECTGCGVWSHVACVLGAHITADDLQELQVCSVVCMMLV